jgi:hypothetical protein
MPEICTSQRRHKLSGDGMVFTQADIMKAISVLPEHDKASSLDMRAALQTIFPKAKFE